MDRALGAISTGTTTAATTNQEAVNRFGMHYQWGRKDPFTPSITTAGWPGGEEVQIYNATGNPITKGHYGIGTTDEEFKYDNTTITTINDLIQNPSTHYAKGDGTNNVPIASATMPRGNKKGSLTPWWNPTIKTLYDPCPNGYRIPKSGTYGQASDWTISNPYSGLTAGYTWKIESRASFFPASGHRSSSIGHFGAVGTSGNSWLTTLYDSTYGYKLHFHSGAVDPINYYYRSEGLPVRCIID